MENSVTITPTYGDITSKLVRSIVLLFGGILFLLFGYRGISDNILLQLIAYGTGIFLLFWGPISFVNTLKSEITIEGDQIMMSSLFQDHNV